MSYPPIMSLFQKFARLSEVEQLLLLVGLLVVLMNGLSDMAAVDGFQWVRIQPALEYVSLCSMD